MINLLAKLYSCLFFYRTRNYRAYRRTLFRSALIERSVRHKAKHLGRLVLFRGKVKVSKTTTIGEGNVINGISIYGSGEVVIGDHCSFGPGLIIQTQNHAYNTGDTLPYGDEFVCKPVHIDNCVWIGMNVTCLPGTHIGEGAIIQAGSVVHGEIPPLAIAGGNPAKVFAWRDKDHYADLKQRNSYCMW